MKRLILFLWMMIGASSFGINITNYPATNAFDGSMTFLLSKASVPTNFNIQADLIASTNWALGTFLLLNGNATSATSAINSTNFWGVLNQTNLPSGVAMLASNNTFTGVNTFNNSVLVNTNRGGLYVGVNTIGGTNTMQIDSISTASALSVNTNGDVYMKNFNALRFLCVSAVGKLFFANNDVQSTTLGTGLNDETGNSPAGSAVVVFNNGPTLNNSTTYSNLQGSTLTATNGVVLMVKPSFTTNFTCTTNLQTYLCNGTNQIVTLPNAAYVPNVIYRFTSTNGYGSYIVTNATGAQTVRDGASLSHKQVGIAPISVFSDGAQWWLAAKDQSVQPNAQFSCSTNIPLTLANTAYPVTFNSTDFNNSQGIALALGTNGTHFSKMWITNSGQYEFTPSIVIGMGNVSHTVRYWFRSNDTNIPASTTPTKVGGNDVIVVTVPFVVNITTPTAIEIWAESDGVNDSLVAGAASGNYPASPSVICPVKRISDTWP